MASPSTGPLATGSVAIGSPVGTDATLVVFGADRHGAVVAEIAAWYRCLRISAGMTASGTPVPSADQYASSSRHGESDICVHLAYSAADSS
jgi:hypothetical protein